MELKKIADKLGYNTERFSKFVKYNYSKKIKKSVFGVLSIDGSDIDEITKAYEKFVIDMKNGNNTIAKVCPKCNSKNINVDVRQVSEQCNRITLGAVIMLVGVFFFLWGALTIALIALVIGVVVMLTQETRITTKTIEFCKDCGNSWEVKDETLEDIDRKTI